jgi:hypothetical protein
MRSEVGLSRTLRDQRATSGSTKGNGTTAERHHGRSDGVRIWFFWGGTFSSKTAAISKAVFAVGAQENWHRVVFLAVNRRCGAKAPVATQSKFLFAAALYGPGRGDVCFIRHTKISHKPEKTRCRRNEARAAYLKSYAQQPRTRRRRGSGRERADLRRWAGQYPPAGLV